MKMNPLNVGILFMVCLSLFGQETRLDRFKKLIDFDASIEKYSKAGGMVGAWPDMSTAPALGSQWALVNQIINVKDGALFQSWGLKFCDDTIEVVCLNFLGNHNNAIQWALSFISSTTKPEIPYLATRNRIGAVSVESRMPNESPDAIFVYQTDYCISIRHYGDSLVDIESIAQWLNSYAESKVIQDVRPYQPVPQQVVVTPGLPKVGQEFEILFQMPGEPVSGRYVVKETQGSHIPIFMDQFTAVGREGLTPESLLEVFRAKKPGKGLFKYMLMDRYTSQFYLGEVEIDVTP
jgi:hypothetical protein